MLNFFIDVLTVPVGGAKSMRQYWNNFVQDTSVFVFVVDSADDDRFSEAFTALHEISGDERLKKVPIVLVANKQVNTLGGQRDLSVPGLGQIRFCGSNTNMLHFKYE